MICDRNVPSVASGLRAVRVELDNAFLVLDNAILVLSLSIATTAPKFTEVLKLSLFLLLVLLENSLPKYLGFLLLFQGLAKE